MLMGDQTGRGHAFVVLDEAVEGGRDVHQAIPLCLPVVIQGTTPVLWVWQLLPQDFTVLLEPGIQRGQGGESRRVLPDPVAHIAYLLLHLPLLPAGRRITELGLQQVMADHGLEALVDRTLLAATDLIHGRFHVVVDPAFRHPAE